MGYGMARLVGALGTYFFPLVADQQMLFLAAHSISSIS